jgi:hypothetical protein
MDVERGLPLWKRGQSEHSGLPQGSAAIALEIYSTVRFSKNITCSPIHKHATTSPTMIPRTLLRQTRAVSSSIRTIPRTSLARPQFRQSNLSFARTSRPATARWYSTEPETQKAEGAAAAESKTEEKSAEAEDPAKKELEAKNKEIIDLKVTPLPLPSRTL